MPPLHVNREVRSLVQIGCGIVSAIISPPVLCTAQRMVDETTIAVTTTQQRVTDSGTLLFAGNIYAAEFASNTALNLTDPDRFYTTGCDLQGNSPPYTIAL